MGQTDRRKAARHQLHQGGVAYCPRTDWWRVDMNQQPTGHRTTLQIHSATAFYLSWWMFQLLIIYLITHFLFWLRPENLFLEFKDQQCYLFFCLMTQILTRRPHLRTWLGSNFWTQKYKNCLLFCFCGIDAQVKMSHYTLSLEIVSFTNLLLLFFIQQLQTITF